VKRAFTGIDEVGSSETGRDFDSVFQVVVSALGFPGRSRHPTSGSM
jgi:hypothetical protein